jgi:hypothetical protein
MQQIHSCLKSPSRQVARGQPRSQYNSLNRERSLNSASHLIDLRIWSTCPHGTQHCHLSQRTGSYSPKQVLPMCHAFFDSVLNPIEPRLASLGWKGEAVEKPFDRWSLSFSYHNTKQKNKWTEPTHKHMSIHYSRQRTCRWRRLGYIHNRIGGGGGRVPQGMCTRGNGLGIAH